MNKTGIESHKTTLTPHPFGVRGQNEVATPLSTPETLFVLKHFKLTILLKPSSPHAITFVLIPTAGKAVLG
jgi:hypothetical protein